MLNCTIAERYANYWAGMDEHVSAISTFNFMFHKLKYGCKPKSPSIVQMIIVFSYLNILYVLQGYYKREPHYFPILYREKQGVFEVPMIFATVLIDMNIKKIKELAYAPSPPGYMVKTCASNSSTVNLVVQFY